MIPVQIIRFRAEAIAFGFVFVVHIGGSASFRLNYLMPCRIDWVNGNNMRPNFPSQCRRFGAGRIVHVRPPSHRTLPSVIRSPASSAIKARSTASPRGDISSARSVASARNNSRRPQFDWDVGDIDQALVCSLRAPAAVPLSNCAVASIPALRKHQQKPLALRTARSGSKGMRRFRQPFAHRDTIKIAVIVRGIADRLEPSPPHKLLPVRISGNPAADE